jgi:hypothetical protein
VLKEEARMFGNTISRYTSDQNFFDHQDVIYGFLLEIVKDWPPDQVLEYFKNLFLYQIKLSKFPASQALTAILMGNDKQVFLHTLKRSCYILVNNWETARQYAHIHELVTGLPDPILYKPALTFLNRRLRSWVTDFVDSQDYQELKIFADRFEGGKRSWHQRYSYYALVSQSENQSNPQEQREAARILSEKIKWRFKLDLAMYVSQTQSLSRKAPSISDWQSTNSLTTQQQPYENPTALGDRTLKIIKLLVLRKGLFSYENLAKIFMEQVQDLSYYRYKRGLLSYLIFSTEKKESSKGLKQLLWDKLKNLYPDRETDPIDEALKFYTCTTVIRFFTTEDDQSPAHLLTSLLSQGRALTLAIFLLKLILICPSCRNTVRIKPRYSRLILYLGHILQQ